MNYDKILLDLKLELVTDIITQRLGPQAGFVASVMLSKFSFYEYANTKDLQGMSVTDIQKQINGKQTNNIAKQYASSLNIQKIEKILESLASDEFNFASKELLFNKSYKLNVGYLIEFLKNKTLEKIIEQQFSSVHTRIYRLLSKCGNLDAKSVNIYL